MAEVNNSLGSTNAVGGTSVAPIFLGQYKSDNDPLNGVSKTGSEKPVTVADVEKIVEEIRSSFSNYIDIQRAYIDSDRAQKSSESDSDVDEEDDGSASSSKSVDDASTQKNSENEDKNDSKYDSASDFLDKITSIKEENSDKNEEIQKNTEKSETSDLTLRNQNDKIISEKIFSEKDYYDLNLDKDDTISSSTDISNTIVDKLVNTEEENTDSEISQKSNLKIFEEPVITSNENNNNVISENSNFDISKILSSLKNDENQIQNIKQEKINDSIQIEPIEKNITTIVDDISENDDLKISTSKNSLIEGLKDNSTLFQNDEQKTDEDDDMSSVKIVDSSISDVESKPIQSSIDNGVISEGLSTADFSKEYDNSADTIIESGVTPSFSETTTVNEISNNTSIDNSNVINNEVVENEESFDSAIKTIDSYKNDEPILSSTVENKRETEDEEPTEIETQVYNTISEGYNSTEQISGKLSSEPESSMSKADTQVSDDIGGLKSSNDNIISILSDIKESISGAKEMIDESFSKLSGKIDGINIPQSSDNTNVVVMKKENTFGMDRIS